MLCLFIYRLFLLWHNYRNLSPSDSAYAHKQTRIASHFSFALLVIRLSKYALMQAWRIFHNPSNSAYAHKQTRIASHFSFALLVIRLSKYALMQAWRIFRNPSDSAYARKKTGHSCTRPFFFRLYPFIPAPELLPSPRHLCGDRF